VVYYANYLKFIERGRSEYLWMHYFLCKNQAGTPDFFNQSLHR
jgi:acyl-CoA thioesterase FadM